MTEKELRVFVDRIEGDAAVLLLGNGRLQVNWPVTELPEGVKEGDLLVLKITKDTTATQAAQDAIGSLIDELGPGE